LAQLFRADLLPEAWIASPAVRQLRALLRHRASLVRLGTQQRNRIDAVAAGHGRSPASSSFVLAAARLRALQLDPSRAAT
jgi:transposase